MVREPKYRFPAGFRKSLVLSTSTERSRADLAQSFWSKASLTHSLVHQSGYPAVVSPHGINAVAMASRLALRRISIRVLLMLDGDAAGRRASIAIDDMLRSRMPVTAISIGDGRQPDQLASEEHTSFREERRNEARGRAALGAAAVLPCSCMNPTMSLN